MKKNALDTAGVRLPSLTAVGGLVGAIPTVVFSVALPPKRNAFVILTHKLRGTREKTTVI